MYYYCTYFIIIIQCSRVIPISMVGLDSVNCQHNIISINEISLELSCKCISLSVYLNVSFSYCRGYLFYKINQ